MYKIIPPDLKELLNSHRLLIIASDGVRQSNASALARNRYICEMADKIIFVGVTDKSSLFTLQEHYKVKILKEVKV